MGETNQSVRQKTARKTPRVKRDLHSRVCFACARAFHNTRVQKPGALVVSPVCACVFVCLRVCVPVCVCVRVYVYVCVFWDNFTYSVTHCVACFHYILDD